MDTKKSKSHLGKCPDLDWKKKERRVKKMSETLNIVFTGHVDHGKSTVIGKMLADTGSLPKGKLEQIRESCRKNSKPFEYAFLLDALKDEQSQGITIDSARCFFKTDSREYQIIDAPGHIEFLKNMVTGASRADAAILVIDAVEGVKENSRRHGYLLHMLGIRQAIVLVNKMDLVEFEQEVFVKIVDEYKKFADDIDLKINSFIPVSGITGDNIVTQSEKMKWYSGNTLLESLDDFKSVSSMVNEPLRMAVSDVYKFTRSGDNRRIIAGTISSGSIQVGDEIIFYPSGKKGKVKTLEGFNRSELNMYEAGEAAGFTLEEQLYIKRGELVAKENELRPKNTSRFSANIFWLGKNPLEKRKEYFLKTGTSKVRMKVEEIKAVLDSSTLKTAVKECVQRNEVSECIIKTFSPVSFDEVNDHNVTSRFVIVDEYEICGGGIITESLSDNLGPIREKVQLRNYKWEKSHISFQDRAARYNQKPTLIIITGDIDSGKKHFAKTLEKRLFSDGRFAYYMGIGNLLYGVDADIKTLDSKIVKRQEHIRRFAEVCHILIESGQIVIVTAILLTQQDLEIFNTIVNRDYIEVLWVGDDLKTDIDCELHLFGGDVGDYCESAIQLLKEHGVIFSPW